MFQAIQAPFEKHCPPDRKNFLSYSYCLYKFCELLRMDEYLNHFSLLKGRDKLYRQDEIFRKICQELNWQFIRASPIPALRARCRTQPPPPSSVVAASV